MLSISLPLLFLHSANAHLTLPPLHAVAVPPSHSFVFVAKGPYIPWTTCGIEEEVMQTLDSIFANTNLTIVTGAPYVCALVFRRCTALLCNSKRMHPHPLDS